MTNPDRYRADDPDRKFLQSREWRERIRPRQLAHEPLCRFCKAVGDIRVADQVDHVKRPFGERALQRDPENFQSLCARHHALKSNWERSDPTKPLVIGRTRDGWETIAAPGGTLKLQDDHDDQPAGFSLSINRNKNSFGVETN